MTLDNKTIIAIDDTPSILTFLQISLESQGADFFSAGTAEAGLSLCQAREPDLVVLDLGLPDTDGLTLLPSIKQVTEAKVVVLTARREDHFKDNALKNGADAYLTKPFMMDELLETVEDVLHS